jgi:mRNA-degrading endonuclease toxin of MazEF toxin-antitoxin module
MARFRVTTDNGHLVIHDNKEGRPVVAILPNTRNPNAPLNIAKVCSEKLNEVWEAHEKKEK